MRIKFLHIGSLNKMCVFIRLLFQRWESSNLGQHLKTSLKSSGFVAVLLTLNHLLDSWSDLGACVRVFLPQNRTILDISRYRDIVCPPLAHNFHTQARNSHNPTRRGMTSARKREVMCSLLLPLVKICKFFFTF